LADYKAFNVKKTDAKVAKKDIEDAIEHLRAQHVKFEEKDKTAGEGDIGVMDVTAHMGEEKLNAYSRDNYELVLGDGYFVPDFDQHVIGMKPGEDKSFTITMPEDYPIKRFQKADIKFDVKLKGIKERILPEVNDDFAKFVGTQDVSDLRKQVEMSLEMTKQEEAERKFQQDVIDKLLKDSKVDVPHVMIHDEIHKMEHEFNFRLKQQGFTLDRYLEARNQTHDDLHKEWHEQAEQVAKTGLLLDEVAKAEGLDVADEEVESEIKAWLIRYRDENGKLTGEGKNIKQNLQSERGRSYLTQMIRREKTRRRLFELAEAKSAKPVDAKADKSAEDSAEAKPKKPKAKSTSDK
jgi:trigger factor